jgi:formate dehydrogenase subunit gamma
MGPLACIYSAERLYISHKYKLYPVREDRMADFEPWNVDRARDIIAGFAGTDGASLPILHRLQNTFGCVPLEAEPLVASALNISRAEVHGIVTFYHEFRRTVPGRHMLHVCRAEACQAVGADAVAAHVRAALAVDWHGTSANGSVTLEPVFCLGLCATGPSALLDGHPIGRLNAARVDRMLETLS